MPSPSFTVWRPLLRERHRSEAIAGRLVNECGRVSVNANHRPSREVLLTQIKKGLWMRFAKPLGLDQLSSFDSSVFGKQWRKKATP
jgi:hypothetical protein